MKKGARLALFVAWCAALATTLISLFALEKERSSVVQTQIMTDAGPVNMYEHPSGSDGPLVFVAHGFAGSHQMMQYMSRDLARVGYRVAAFDFFGHGRNTHLLSPDVSSIEGTTQQLVDQTTAVIDAVRSVQGVTRAEFGLLGHSMATDIIIRAAADFEDAKSIVAISMYSDAVTAVFPQNLLILSGQWEDRLREVGLRLIAQVDPQAGEGQTVSNGTVTRRTDYIPYTEHVAVLYSAATQKEIRAWLDQTLGPARPDARAPGGRGAALMGAFAGLIAVFALSIWAIPRRISTTPQVPLPRFGLSLIVPAFCAAAAAAIVPSTLIGLSAFGSLLAFLAVWGIAQLLCVGRRCWDLERPHATGFLILLICGGAIFAFVLDRYAAAFLPTGVRLHLMALLLPATLLFACADRMLVRDAPVWRRFVARLAALLTLGLCMATLSDFGLLFTVVPVLALFYVVYGTMGRAVAQRFGPLTAGLALGVILAWSIAASTPLFAA